ncbi:MAG: aminotransferase class I/II-fold pyridoxal phosphate-dependent enzyme [Gammaproteobacteria bacterium]|nr:aminotransferase class I/II-fold pyridoxal phosphate-dependent enzyme [Gammaproteobacteria bacterium]
MSDQSRGDDWASLSLSEDEMRRLGYAVVDLIIAYHRSLGSQPLVNAPDCSAHSVDIQSSSPFPEVGQAPMQVLTKVKEAVLADMIHVSDPRFFGYIPSPGNFVGAMADALASGFNVFAGTASHCRGPTQVETACCRWLASLAGLPDTAGGTFVSGGSVANLTAVVLARHRILGDSIADARAYCSDQTHSSLDRAFRILGFGNNQLVRIPSDTDFRADPEALWSRLRTDRAAGLRPFLVIGNLGTTSTGAADPLGALAEIAVTENIWLHVDAAYGGGALLNPHKRAEFADVGRAHSVTMDQHKWFFQPIECASLLVRDMSWLHEFFHATPSYLKDSAAAEEGINYRDHGIQLTRGFRALKLWMSLQTFGVQAFAAAVEHGLRMAEEAESLLRARPGWSIISPATLGIVSFRFEMVGLGELALDRLNESINRALVSEGKAFTTTTELRGRKVLRLCTINPRMELRHIRQTIGRLDAIARQLTNPH